MSDETTPPPASPDQASAESIPAAVESTLASEGKTLITPIPLMDPALAPATQEQLETLRVKFQDELDALNQQIVLLQVKATALEAQLNSIEPKIEARASRTEKLVAELQIEIIRMMKAQTSKEKSEGATLTELKEIKAMLTTFLGKK